MATQGPSGPGAGSASGGGATWNNPGNITAEDSTYATCNQGGVAGNSQTLTGGTFGFSVSGTILGFLVEWKRFRQAGSNNILDVGVYINNNGTLSTNLSAGAVWTGSLAYASFGGSSNLWGLTVTAANVNNANFQVQTVASLGKNVTAAVDYVRMTVTYTPAAGGLFRQTAMSGVDTGGPFFANPMQWRRDGKHRRDRRRPRYVAYT